MAMSYRDAVLADNPLAYWPLNETAGTTATDASGNGYHGAYSGGYTLGQAAPGGRQGVSFDGASGFVDTTIPAADIPPPNALSIEAWVYIRTYTVNIQGGYHCASILEAAENARQNPYGFVLSQQQAVGTWWWLSGNPATNDYGTHTSQNAWAHVVMTMNSGGSGTPYFNGAAETTFSGRTYPSSGATWLRIGHAAWTGGWLDGAICDVAYYDYELSADRVLVHYTAGLGDLKLRIIGAAPMRYLSAPLPPAMYTVGNRLLRARTVSAADQIYGGRGQISGTVTVADQPAVRHVLLLLRKSHLVVAATWSAPDGSYKFDWIDERLTYTVLAHDYTGQYNAVVADNVTPEPIA
jgi:hypothetical protein